MSWRRSLAPSQPSAFSLCRSSSGLYPDDEQHRRIWTSSVTAARVGHVLVLEAIDASHAKGSAAIGDVAVELGLDRSNASRMLAAAVDAGLVTKTVSPADGRRTDLRATASGCELLASARAWQQHTFTQLVEDWPAQDARRFAGYLQRLAAQPLDRSTQGDRG